MATGSFVAASLVPTVGLGQATKPSEPGSGRSGKGGRRTQEVQPAAKREDWAVFSTVVGRVSAGSATLSLVSEEQEGVTVSVIDGAGAVRGRHTATLKPGQASEVVFEGLAADTEYGYRVESDRKVGRAEARVGRFRTCRGAGVPFSFTVQGDSHPERPQMFDAALYAKTLGAIAATKPDFHICMGDDFSIAKLPELTADSIASRYLLQRPYLGIVGRVAPVFLVNGNHEQASLYNYEQPGVAHDAAVWAQQARNRLFPLPSPDGFFTGNPRPREGIGQMRDYYAWSWGDALCVVLDNYWHSPVCVDTRLNETDARGQGKNRDGWGITIGDEQYAWLTQTLEKSDAKFKFVFAHHVMGTGRGGVERAGFYEWGGRSERGADEFQRHRPKWALPVHGVLAKYGVSALFQGHDHLYARQELDGVVYQTVPMPADPNYSTYNADRYGSGVKLPNSGYLKVTVDGQQATVQYVRSYRDGDSAGKDGEIAHQYTLATKRKS